MTAAADSTAPLTPARLALATRLLGETPAAWGRYFNGFHTHADEYSPGEAAAFTAAKMKLIPIAQQTPKVGGTALDGAAQAAVNVDKFVNRVGAGVLAASGSEFLIFLDVEGQPSLSPDYWLGWSKTIVSASRDESEGKFTMLPAVYARTGDAQTWNAIRAAVANGAQACAAAWVARYHTDACTKPRPSWEKPFLTPQVALPFPIFLWQYAIDCPDGNGVDCDLVAPDGATLLDRLAVP